MDYFKAIQGGVGLSHRKDVEIRFAKRRFSDEFRRSVNYFPDAKRNGQTQPFLVTGSDSLYKADVTAFPDDELYDGDIIECYGERWIVTQARATNPFYKSGIMWMCNQLFRFQLGDSRIIERWGVLDSGVYSTTLSGDYRLHVLDKQYKVYLPYDEDTKRLAVDKRFATGQGFNTKGEPILSVYTFTGVDPISKSYEANGHLLVMNARSDEYIPGIDNYDLMVCNYIEPDGSEPLYEKPISVIDGSKTIGLGKTKEYSARFLDADGIQSEVAIPVWTYEIPQDISGLVSATVSDGKLIITAKDDTSLVGREINIELRDTTDWYYPANLRVEVSIL